MRAPLPRLARLGLPAVAALALALGGCGEPTPAAPSEAPTSTTPTSTTPTAPTGSATRVTPPATSGSDGLTVRYLGDDGTVKTVPVEDFPR